MNIPLTILFSLLGLIFGSFFNVIGLRLPKKIPFANDRSKCPHCNQQLAWYENIPVFSFLFLRGRCRYCDQRIAIIYPITEIVTGILFGLSYALIGIKLELITVLLLVSMLMIILVSDLTYMLIPNKILLFFLPFLVCMRIVVPLHPWWSAFVGSILGFCLVLFIILVSRGGMGGGDMKLFGVLGIVLGAEKILLAFFLSCIIGAVVGLLLLMFKRTKRKEPVPFGPFIAFGTLITYFFGDTLLNWYSNLMIYQVTAW